MAKVNGAREPPLKTVISMKENTSSIKNQVLALSRGSQVTSTVVATKMTRGTATARCTGQMAAATRVNGKVESNMASVRCHFLMAASRKVSSKTTFTSTPQLI